MRPIGDRSQPFILFLVVSWVALIAIPLVVSLLTGHLYGGLPALGVVVWFVLLRLARWLSPPVRADRLMRRGRYAEAIAWCDRALAVEGPAMWRGGRRLVWLTRKATAELALCRGADALTTAVEALTISGDPQTIGTAAAALLYLNRYSEAENAARLALQLTRERSVSANATLAEVLLARGQPADAEAHARAGLIDIEMLLPMVTPEHYATCLLSLSRALRVQGHRDEGQRFMRRCERATRRRPALRAMLNIERAEYLSQPPQQQAEAMALVESAAQAAPRYVHWYASQPRTLTALREQPRIVALLTHLEAQHQYSVPEATLRWVTITLDKAAHAARARPAAQSSREALSAQLILLAGTAVILGMWAWHFYLAVSP